MLGIALSHIGRFVLSQCGHYLAVHDGVALSISDPLEIMAPCSLYGLCASYGMRGGKGKTYSDSDNCL